MLRWMAPFLSFTSEEAWKVFGSSESIFLETYAILPAPDTALLAKWSRIREIRDLVNKDIEVLRAEGKVGSSLQVNLKIFAPTVPQGAEVGEQHRAQGLGSTWAGIDYDALASLKDDLKFVFITSKVEVVRANDSGGSLEVSPSSSQKCERCWHYRDDIGIDPAHPAICGRCSSNLYGAGEVRTFA